MKISCIHPDSVRASRAPQVGTYEAFHIKVTNDEEVTHRDTVIYLNPVGPEVWYIRGWTPRVTMYENPGGGLLFMTGEIRPGQSFTLSVELMPPPISETRAVPIEVYFKSSEGPWKPFYKGKIMVQGHRRATRA
ncbi:MAG: hypothetical protein ACE5Z5_00765 [Candidatus Bathyarchaeia archaeon]